MDKMLHVKMNEIQSTHRHEHKDYEYFRRDLLPKGVSNQCKISIYEVPPSKAAYPYHYHVKNEESFYILSGKGLLKTPAGEKVVVAGDFLFFPANEAGAHKLTNISDDESLVYLDYDTAHDLDVCFYPDSNKIGIWGKGTNQLYPMDQQVEYYDGE